MTRSLFFSCIAAASLAAVSPLSAANEFAIKLIPVSNDGSIMPAAISSTGVIVGSRDFGRSGIEWTPKDNYSTPILLPEPAVGFMGSDILMRNYQNSEGDILHSADGSITHLPFSPLAANNTGTVIGINADGDLMRRTSDGSIGYYFKGFNQPVTAYAASINDQGNIVGLNNDGAFAEGDVVGGYQIFEGSSGSDPFGATSIMINNKNEVVGSVGDQYARHVVRWNFADASMIRPITDPGGMFMDVTGINDAGDISAEGYGKGSAPQAFAWFGNDYSTPIKISDGTFPDHWFYFTYGINADGQILGYGKDMTIPGDFVFVASPASGLLPEPSSCMILIFAYAASVRGRKCRSNRVV